MSEEVEEGGAGGEGEGVKGARGGGGGEGKGDVGGVGVKFVTGERKMGMVLVCVVSVVNGDVTRRW